MGAHVKQHVPREMEEKKQTKRTLGREKKHHFRRLHNYHLINLKRSLPDAKKLLSNVLFWLINDCFYQRVN